MAFKDRLALLVFLTGGLSAATGFAFVLTTGNMWTYIGCLMTGVGLLAVWLADGWIQEDR